MKTTIEVLDWRIFTGGFWTERRATIQHYQLWEIYFQVDASGGSVDGIDTPYYFPSVQIIVGRSVRNQEENQQVETFIKEWCEKHFGYWIILKIERTN